MFLSPTSTSFWVESLNKRSLPPYLDETNSWNSLELVWFLPKSADRCNSRLLNWAMWVLPDLVITACAGTVSRKHFSHEAVNNQLRLENQALSFGSATLSVYDSIWIWNTWLPNCWPIRRGLGRHGKCARTGELLRLEIFVIVLVCLNNYTILHWKTRHTLNITFQMQ